MPSYNKLSAALPNLVVTQDCPSPLYLCCVRASGRRWLAVAGTSSGGCIAAAADVFKHFGYVGECRWAESVQSQKNYAGRSESFKVVELCDSDRLRSWAILSIGRGCWRSVDAFLEIFPHCAEFRADLDANFHSIRLMK